MKLTYTAGVATKSARCPRAGHRVVFFLCRRAHGVFYIEKLNTLLHNTERPNNRFENCLSEQPFSLFFLIKVSHSLTVIVLRVLGQRQETDEGSGQKDGVISRSCACAPRSEDGCCSRLWRTVWSPRCNSMNIMSAYFIL